MRAGWAIGLCFLMGCASLPAPPAGTVPDADDDDPLTLAAECLSRGEETQAAGHFERYVKGHPDQLMFRVHLADLYLKIRRDAEARPHYERFVAGAQECGGAPASQLVHCHTKLMEIAQRGDDRFEETLNRGIGLVLLTRQESQDEGTREEILCQAIASLLEAKEMRPGEARTFVYLAEAHDRAGNRRAADAARSAARQLALPGSVTSFELRSASPRE